MTITGPSPENNTMRAMTKAELAKRAGVSHDTFERWLNERLEELVYEAEDE